MSLGAEFPRSRTRPKDNLCRTHFGTRSERHTRSTAAEHSIGSCSGRVFFTGYQNDRDDLHSVRLFCLRGSQTVRDAFGVLPDVVG